MSLKGLLLVWFPQSCFTRASHRLSVVSSNAISSRKSYSAIKTNVRTVFRFQQQSRSKVIDETMDNVIAGIAGLENLMMTLVLTSDDK